MQERPLLPSFEAKSKNLQKHSMVWLSAVLFELMILMTMLMMLVVTTMLMMVILMTVLMMVVTITDSDDENKKARCSGI